MSKEEQLFDAAMDMSWALFDCPWEYLSGFQKFTIRLTIALFFIAGWMNKGKKETQTVH